MKPTMNHGQFNLSEYLGFGILDQNSIISDERGIKATYSSAGEKVYGINWVPAKCEIEEFYGGRSIAFAEGDNLQLAFFHLLQGMNPTTHARFFKLVNDVIQIGNIYFVWPNMKNGYLYYPAGFLFSLTQPIANHNIESWIRLKSNIEQNKTGYAFAFDAQKSGALFKFKENGSIEREDVTLVQMSCTLLNLYKTAKECKDNGLIQPTPEYRMTIVSAGERLDPYRLITGDLKSGIKYCSVYEFGTEPWQVSDETAQSTFKRLCGLKAKEQC